MREDEDGREGEMNGGREQVKWSEDVRGMSWREKKREKGEALGRIRNKAEAGILMEIAVLARNKKTPEDSESGQILDYTYVNLTENNVYYAANHNQGVEHIPGVSKIALSEVERVFAGFGVRPKK